MQPIGVLVAAYSRQHGEAEFEQMQRSRLPDTGGAARDQDSPPVHASHNVSAVILRGVEVP
jgi:hypothetical protein